MTPARLFRVHRCVIPSAWTDRGSHAAAPGDADEIPETRVAAVTTTKRIRSERDI
jgi:hypothetical protein